MNPSPNSEMTKPTGRLPRPAAGVLALALLLGGSGCRDRGAVEAATLEDAAPATSALLLAAREGGALLPPEYADPRLADESTLDLRPLELPAFDFTRAPLETEPNDRPEEATPLGTGAAARGELNGSEYDYFTFTTEGEPQLWAVEAVGSGIGLLRYQSSAREEATGAEVEPGRWMIANLFLAPGRHLLAVRGTGTGGAYTLRAVPLGPPDPRMEREPNDDASFAHPLRFGITRAGHLLDDGDRDTYRFSLRGEEHVSLRVTPPDGMVLRVDLSGESLSDDLRFTAAEPGEPMRLQALLPMGDYIVTLRSQSGHSRTPYRIRVDRLGRFDLPADVEPNNRREEASPFPADHVLHGRVGEFGDDDWYLLPPVQRETSLRVEVLGTTGQIRPQDVIAIFSDLEPGSDLVTWNAGDGGITATLPAGAPLRARVRGRGSYRLQLHFDPALPAAAAPLPLGVSVPPGPHLVEAFSESRQRVEVPVTLENRGATALQVSLEGVASHYAWRAAGPNGRVTVEPGRRVVVPFHLDVPPDAAAEPVQFAVRAVAAGGAPVGAATELFPLCGAPPVGAEPNRPLPPALRGGFNLAASAHGARVIGDDDAVRRQAVLFDGLTARGDEVRLYPTGDTPPEVTIALAGEAPIPVAGITLIPGVEYPKEQLRDFELLVSEDGERFQRVLAGSLARGPVEQDFTLPRLASARFARLRFLSPQGGDLSRGVRLAEWKVIAQPGRSPFADAAVNLADPELGGYLVWSYPVAPVREGVLNGTSDHSLRLEPTRLNEWVIGFRQNRAAQVERFEWVQPSAPTYRVLSRVDVSVSTESPTGPWTPVGTWKLDVKRESTSVLELPAPVWARFVRFSSNEPERADEWWRLPKAIRVFERSQAGDYRSILGEWGHYARAGIYEQLVTPAPPSGQPVAGNGRRESAHRLQNGTPTAGRVQVEDDEDWFEIAVPRGHNRVTVEVMGDPMLRVAAVLLDADGAPVSVEAVSERGRALRIEAAVQGGRSYFLHVTEPPRTIALVWDNSGSVGPYKPTLYRALARFTEQVQPRREFVNLLPFHDRGPRFLAGDWSDQPWVLQGALQNYDRSDGSSNAEVSLRSATEALRERPGNTAIVFLTDADSGGYPETAELWRALAEVRPRVFAVELHGGSEAASQQQLMRSWADASNGHYSVFRTSEDVDVAFERAACYLRRPARFVVTATTSELYDALVAQGRVAMQGILFDTGSDRLRPESRPLLEEITGMLKRHPDLRLLIEGHTDNVGRMAANQTLSEKRAAAVRAYLVGQGIAEARLESRGYGDTMPTASNESADGRQQNRRVELVRL